MFVLEINELNSNTNVLNLNYFYFQIDIEHNSLSQKILVHLLAKNSMEISR